MKEYFIYGFAFLGLFWVLYKIKDFILDYYINNEISKVLKDGGEK